MVLPVVRSVFRVMYPNSAGRYEGFWVFHSFCFAFCTLVDFKVWRLKTYLEYNDRLHLVHLFM